MILYYMISNTINVCRKSPTFTGPEIILDVSSHPSSVIDVKQAINWIANRVGVDQNLFSVGADLTGLARLEPISLVAGGVVLNDVEGLGVDGLKDFGNRENLSPWTPGTRW